MYCTCIFTPKYQFHSNEIVQKTCDFASSGHSVFIVNTFEHLYFRFMVCSIQKCMALYVFYVVSILISLRDKLTTPLQMTKLSAICYNERLLQGQLLLCMPWIFYGSSKIEKHFHRVHGLIFFSKIVALNFIYFAFKNCCKQQMFLQMISSQSDSILNQQRA